MIVQGFEPVRGDEVDPSAKGFIQLCSDRRYHREIMIAFERETGLEPSEYFIEARPGGAASWADTTRMGRFAYRSGVGFMGWAGHGDVCRGFRSASNHELRRKLERTARRRAEDFPRASHYLLFGVGAAEIEVLRIA
jgi:hypothetical protein